MSRSSKMAVPVPASVPIEIRNAVPFLVPNFRVERRSVPRLRALVNRDFRASGRAQLFRFLKFGPRAQLYLVNTIAIKILIRQTIVLQTNNKRTLVHSKDVFVNDLLEIHFTKLARDI